jgi:flagellin-like protein
LRLNKKGVSEIIGYVLLIVIALSLGGIVFSFLRSSIPQEKSSCPDGISLIIEKASCKGDRLNLTFVNRGLFSVDGSLVKMGVVDRVKKDIINCPNGLGTSNCTADFGIENGLKPEDYLNVSIFYGKEGDFELEIEPMVRIENTTEIILCPRSIVVQEITC